MHAVRVVSRSRIVAMAVLAVAVAVALSGCDLVHTYFPGPISVGQVDGRLLIGVCAATRAEDIDISVRNVPRNDDYRTVVEYKGHGVLQASDVIDVTKDLPGMTAITRNSDGALHRHDDVSALIKGSPLVSDVVADVPFDTLGSRWFFSDGKTGDTPCGHYIDSFKHDQ